MVVPLMLRGDYCIRKDLRSPYIVSMPSRLPGGKEALENICLLYTSDAADE